MRIEVGNFGRMIEADVGIGVLPESAARRYAQTMAVRLLHLSDDWALRDLKVCVRSLNLLPALTADAAAG